VALRVLARSVTPRGERTLELRLPEQGELSGLDGLRTIDLFILRFLLQTDGATRAEIAAGLRYPRAIVKSSLLAATMRGWVEPRDSRHRVAWDWYRSVTRVLARKNLIASTELKAETAEQSGGTRRRRDLPAQGRPAAGVRR
jgi:hypothetical protein